MKRMIDIVRTSASRPDLLQRSTESLLEKILWDGDTRMILHEDVLNKEASNKCIKWAEKSGLFDIIEVSNPPITQGPSLCWLMSKITSEYFLNWEDDFLAVRPIDLNLVVKVMDENKDVNQIAFHKRQTMSNRHGWPKKEVVRSGVWLTTNPHWAFTPSIERTSFIKPQWVDLPKFSNPVWIINPIVKKTNVMRSAEWLIENVGCYFLGKIGESAFSKHIGEGQSVRKGETVRSWS